MLSRVTHGTLRDSIILAATVVFPEALPPQIPVKELRLRKFPGKIRLDYCVLKKIIIKVMRIRYI